MCASKTFTRDGTEGNREGKKMGKKQKKGIYTLLSTICAGRAVTSLTLPLVIS